MCVTVMEIYNEKIRDLLAEGQVSLQVACIIPGASDEPDYTFWSCNIRTTVYDMRLYPAEMVVWMSPI